MQNTALADASTWAQIAAQFPVIVVIFTALFFLRRWENQRLDKKEEEHHARNQATMERWQLWMDQQRAAGEAAQHIQAQLHVSAFQKTSEQLSKSFELVAEELGHLTESNKRLEQTNAELTADVRSHLSKRRGDR